MTKFRFIAAGISAVAGFIFCQPSLAQTGPNAVQTSQLNVQVLPEVSSAVRLRHTDPNQVLHVSVSLPYADPEGMQAFVDRVSDPKSPDYGHFMTPEQIGESFGLPFDRVRAIANYLNSKGFTVKLIADNRLSILVDGTVAQAEAAFGTTIDEYQTGDHIKRTVTDRFFAFSKPLRLPSTIAKDVIDVSGLENFTRPQPRALTPTQTRVLYNLAPIYNASMQGQGRSVAISNFDGFRLTNVPLYYSQFGLPTPPGGVNSNVHVVAISGGAGSGTPQGEGDLDIQMVLGMAPLCDFTIYDGGASDLIGTLTREANDNTADIISESYGWNLPTTTANSAHNIHLSMSAQGITYMAASGDSGTTIEPFSYPNYEPEVLMVGGTTATVTSAGVRTSEVGWSGSGGGWSTKAVAFNVRPSWQAGTGVPTNINFRMAPDVSLHASSSSGAYQFYMNGSLQSGFIGTSFACPVFAGGLALAEQKIISLGGLPANGAGKRRFGRIQDLIYGQNGRTDVWTDITSGSNGTLPNGQTSSCTAKWDMVTGWGAINFDAFVATQVSTGGPPPAPTGLAATAGNAQVALTWNASTGATSYNIKRATVSGGPYSTVGTSTTPTFTNTGLTNGTTYFYVVTAVNSSGESGNSNQASATPNNTTTTQLLLNPGFESGAVNWVQTAGVIDNSTGRPARTGSWKAWLNGYGTTHTDSLYQDVTIPSTANNATLTFWLRIDSAETTTTTQFDKLQVQVRNTSNTVLSTLATYSNLNKGTSYVQRTFNLTAFKGQTIRVYLLGTEDSSLQTSFVADDFALTVN